MSEMDYKLVLLCPQTDLGITLLRDDIADVLRVLAEQVLDFESYYYLSGKFADALSDKYTIDLSYKWYVFALNAMTYRMEMGCAKLLSPHKGDMSFYNLLKFLCQETNYRVFIGKNNKRDFDSIIECFNAQLLPAFKDIKKRRNKLNAHNDKGYLLNSERLLALGEMSTEMYYKALCFLKENLDKMYQFYEDGSLFDLDTSNRLIYNCQTQIERFVSSLNDVGDLN